MKMFEESAKTPVALGGLAQQTPVLERLKGQRNELQKRVKNLDDAIAKLEKNPQIAEILESLNKLGHY